MLVDMIAAPRVVEPPRESSAQRREVAHDERDPEWKHPKPEHGQEAEDAACHRDDTEHRARASRNIALRPPDGSVRDDHEAMPPVPSLASGLLGSGLNG